MNQKLTQELTQNIINYYRSTPMTIQHLAEHFKLSVPTIIKMLQNNKVERWNKYRLLSPELDENYFDNIDNETKAYFLGLLLTDGNVYVDYSSNTRQKLFSLSLKQEDAYLLKIFKEQIHSHHKITTSSNNVSHLQVYSTKMVESLIKLGVEPQKSTREQFPFEVKKDMWRHILRGIFDGDGSAGFYARPNRKSHRKCICFCNGGTKLLEQISNFLFEELGITKPVIRHECNAYIIRYTQNEAMEAIINYMYGEATVFLQRKKDVCNLILKEIRQYRDN